MVTQPYSNTETFASENSVLDAATTVWAVLQSADALPATPENRERLVRGRARLRALLAATGLTEDEIRAHALSRAQRYEHRSSPPDCLPSRRELRLLRGDG